MKKALFITFTILLLTTSCNNGFPFFGNEKINFTQIDEMPIFPECKDIEDKKSCFYNSVKVYMSQNLKFYELHSSRVMDDTIILHLEIGKDGKAFMHKLEVSEELKKAIPNLESSVHESIIEFPILTPAKKNGIVVDSRYVIPLLLQN